MRLLHTLIVILRLFSIMCMSACAGQTKVDIEADIKPLIVGS